MSLSVLSGDDDDDKEVVSDDERFLFIDVAGRDDCEVVDDCEDR